MNVRRRGETSRSEDLDPQEPKREASGKITLSKGRHDIRVEFTPGGVLIGGD